MQVVPFLSNTFVIREILNKLKNFSQQNIFFQLNLKNIFDKRSNL